MGMMTRSARLLKRTVLSCGVVVAIALSTASRVIGQNQPRQTSSVPVVLTQFPAAESTVQAVASVGMTVSDMDRILEFTPRFYPFAKFQM